MNAVWTINQVERGKAEEMIIAKCNVSNKREKENAPSEQLKDQNAVLGVNKIHKSYIDTNGRSVVMAREHCM